MPSGRPPARGCQLWPPSVDLKMPPPVPLNSPFSQGPSLRLPQCGINDIRIRWIDLDVAGADVFVFVEDLLEGLAAIGRAIDPALWVRAVGVPSDGDEDAVSIVRINGYLRNLLAIAQSQVGPCRATVRGFIDTVSDREIGPMQPFTAGDVDDVRIGRRDLEGPNRASGFVIEDRRPRAAEIRCLPYPTIHCADVEDIRLARHARDCAGAAAAKRANISPVQFAQKPGVNLLSLSEGSKAEGCKQEEERNCRRDSRH